MGADGSAAHVVRPPDDPASTCPESEAAEAFFAGEQSDGDLEYSNALGARHCDDRLIVSACLRPPLTGMPSALSSRKRAPPRAVGSSTGSPTTPSWRTSSAGPEPARARPWLTDRVSEHLSAVDDAQLERWAYGRATTPDEHSRAAFAAAELQRRATLERERAELAEGERAAAETHARAVANGNLDDTSSEHPESPLTDDERRHRRRMLATGWAGITAAALALAGGVAVLSQPNPDPMAIFDREETQLDRNWTQRLESWGYGPLTAGPRTIEVGDEYVVIATRISTVPDGRSTEWDSYCLHVASPASTNDGSWGLSTACSYPEKFEREGLTLPDRPSRTGGGFDTAFWGPDGEPRFSRNEPLYEETGLVSSVLDWMSLPMSAGPESPGENLIDDPERLLMGPAVVPVMFEGDAASVFRDVELVASVLLISGERPADGPLLCVHVAVGDSEPRMPCTDLSTARREGFEVPFTVDGRTLVVAIGPDGRDRSDTVRLIG